MGKLRRRNPPRLYRRSATRNPKTKIFLVCEGKLTEPEYFGALARHCRALIGVELILEGGVGVPLSVLRRARELLQRPRDEFGLNDEVWAVFDRDEHPGVAQAINEATTAGISVAYSNPCFELWLVLHYRDNDGPVRRDQIQRTLRDLMPGYDPNGAKRVKFAEICETVERAEHRAETMERRRIEERNLHGNPSTTVFRLTQQIRRHGQP